MKGRFSRLLALLLTLLFLIGCAPKADKDNAADAPLSPGLEAGLLKEGWPTDLAPAELPEYTEGTVVNSGEDNGTLYIKIRDTDQDKLDQYLETLKDAGWIVTVGSDEAEAVYGLYTADFGWQDGGALLQMTICTMDAGAWPSDQIPPDVLRPQGALVGSVEVLETSAGMWYFNYTCDGVDETGAQAYMALLIENGWSGDISQTYKNFEWKGKQYEAIVEIYETVETRTTFTCNFYLAE